MPRKLLNPKELNGSEIEQLNSFWKKHGHLYTKKDQNDIRRYLLNAYKTDSNIAFYLSILSYVGVLSENNDIYKWFLTYLKEYYPHFLDKNILEVACGTTPALTKLIADEITETNSQGSITGMDKTLAILEIVNAKLKQENITCDTNLTSYDTIIGLAPCEATPIALKKACIEEKEISLVLCGCVHSDGKAIYPSYEAYLNHLYNIVKYHISSNFTYDITSVPKQFNYEYPVLSLKRK